MRLWWRILLLASLTLMAALSAERRGHAQEIAGWLEQRGLRALLVTHLEEQMEATRDPQRRTELAARVARVYAELLDEASDAERVAALERQGRRLLESVVGIESDELRLALLSASQRSAARTLERWRLRQGRGEEAAAALATLNRILPELRDLSRTLNTGQQALQRKLSRSSGVESAMLTQEIERWGRLRSQATFLTAWSLYYAAWMERRPELLREAEGLFIELLDTGSKSPGAEDISLDLRELEPYARAILGLALVRGLLQRPAAAEEWLALLEQPPSFEALRQELPAWRLSILLDGGRWEEATQLVKKMAADPATPALWLRLAAARALEDAGAGKDSSSLAQIAVAALASRGEIGHVLDLVRRSGAEGLEAAGIKERGFVLHYVRGVERFDAARARHGGNEPLTGAIAGIGDDAATIALYDEAARELRAAVEQLDAPSFPEAAVAAQALAGWCRWYAGRWLDAADAFEKASATQRPPDAAESLWMALLSLDRLRGAPSADHALAARADRLAQKLLNDHPGSPRTPFLLLRVAAGGDATPEQIDQLLAVPASSAAFPAARRAAVQALYGLYRRASGVERTEAAQRFLATAVPLFDEEEPELATMDDTQRVGFLIRGRQLLDAALAPGVTRHELARKVLERLITRGEEGVLDLEPLHEELGFRRLELNLHAGDLAAAERQARELLERGTVASWREAIAKAMFRDAVERWRAAGPAGLDDASALRPVVEWGGHLLRSAEEEQDLPLRRAAFADPAIQAVLATTIEAGARLLAINGDRDLGERTLVRLDELALARPNDAAALRWDAQVSQALGQDSRALAKLRTLVAGAGVGSELWFESKWRLLTILARTDPARAREVLEQHKALQPDYGPPPWDERLRELDARIPASRAGAPAGDQMEMSGEGASSAGQSALRRGHSPPQWRSIQSIRWRMPA
jgi:hypothetical protein